MHLQKIFKLYQEDARYLQDARSQHGVRGCGCDYTD